MQVVINDVNVKLTQKEGKVFTDSKTVSDVFGKEHSGSGGVMSVIEAMPQEFRGGNFTESRYKTSQGKMHKCYSMSRDGMTMLIMSFTGKKAFEWKAKYIEAFKKMEDKLIKHSSLQLDIHLERLDTLTEIARSTTWELSEHGERLDALEQNRRLEAWQEKALQDAKNKKVYELAQDDKELIKKLHMKIWQLFKKRFHLPRYNALTVGRYEDGLMYLNNLTMAEVV